MTTATASTVHRFEEAGLGKAPFLEYRHNNANDFVILVDDSGLVRSDWAVTPDVLRDFCDCSQDASDWDDRGGVDHKPDDYGTLAARRGCYELQAIDVELWESRVAFMVH